MRQMYMLFGTQLVALVAASALAAQQDPPVPEEAATAAEAMVSRFADSWNHADGGSYGENYWPDAELVNPSGQIRRGRAAIVREHVELWSGIFKGSHAGAHIRRVRMLGSSHMMVDFDVDVSGVGELPPGAPADAPGVLHNHLKHVMERRDGVWKILAAQNTFIAGADTPLAARTPR